MPKGVIKMVTKLRRRFLWAGTLDKRKLCKVSWSPVVKEKQKGGLGERSLDGKNITLIFKWLWRIGDQTNEDWKEIVTKIH
jgi:hypothetical protein